MRPKSVERFEVLFLVSLGIGLVISALNWQNLIQMAGPAFVLLVQAGTLLILLVLVLLVSRKGSNVARWVLLVMFLFGSIMYIPSAAQMLKQNPINAILSTIQLVIQVVAMFFIFSADAKPWFKRKTGNLDS